MTKRHLNITVDEEVLYQIRLSKELDGNLSNIVNEFLKSIVQSNLHIDKSIIEMDKKLEELNEKKSMIIQEIGLLTAKKIKKETQEEKAFAEEVELGKQVRATYLLNRRV